MSFRRKESLMKEPSLTKKSSLVKRASLAKKASLRKSSSLAKEVLLTKESSLTKETSLTRQTSLTKRVSLTKKTSLTKTTSLTKDASVPVPETLGKVKNYSSKNLWYIRGSYVTVRNDEGGWFLCRLQNNVYNTTKEAKIRWLSKETDGDDELCYELSYHDVIDPACILCNVPVLRERRVYKLSEKDRLEANKILKFSVGVASGEMMTSDVDSDVEEVIQIDPPPKRSKKEKQKGNEKEKKTKRMAGEKKKREPKAKTERVKKVPKKKKIDDKVLHPKPDVHIYEKDPMFDDNTPFPYFISKYAHTRLVFRAVKMRNHAALRKLLKSTGKIRHVNNWRSVADRRTPFQYAMAVGDKEAMKILNDDFLAIQETGSLHQERMKMLPDKINVSKLGTGTSGSSSHTPRLMASRGSKEGNNALIKDLTDMIKEEATDDIDSYMAKDRKLNMDQAMRIGIDFDVFKDYFICGDEYEMDIYSNVYNSFLSDVDEALIRGHYQLAGAFMKDVISKSNQRFQNLLKLTLHYTVLTTETELKNAPPSQVAARMKQCKMITPIHCAACNPDTQYLERLLKVEPDVHVADRENRRPIHFAAGCQGTGPLELLLSSTHNANLYDSDRNGNMALHYAVQAGRLHNVELLLQAGADNKGGDDPFAGRYGVAGINRPNKKSYTPLHIAIACQQGYIDVIQLLVEKGADVNAVLKVSHFKLTPLMMAAQFGLFNIAVYLVKNGAEVQKRDRLGRSAVVHAAMNGNTNVLSYLLNIGANPNLCDNSGNSPLHYAAAYGWFFCVQSLLQAGADVNVGNNWKTTPLSIAYLKGHVGIVSYLLTNADVDVNFVDDDGMTLLFTAASSALEPDLYTQIVDLVKERGGNCAVTDLTGATPLHYLASNDILLDGTESMRRPSDVAMDTSVKIARFLIENGCGYKSVNKAGWTAAMAAMRSGNLKLFKFLIEKECPVYTNLDDEGFNILHHMSNDHMDSLKGYVDILKFAVKQNGKNGTQNVKKQLCTMANEYCHTGYTPLLLACYKYAYCEKRYTSNWRWTDENQEAVRDLWKQGREFINILISESSSDVNAKVREIHFGEEQEKPRHERERYDDYSVAKWTPTDMVLSIKKSESGEDKKETDPECPALKMLLKHNPDLDTRDTEGHTTLTRQVASKETMPMAKILIKESAVDVNCYRHQTLHSKQVQTWAFISATLLMETELVKLMIENGADVNIRNTDGNTALHAAVTAFHQSEEDSVVLDIVETLIESGAEIDAVNNEDRTPLHLAVNQLKGGLDDNYDVILTLITNGALLTAKDKFGRIPLHFSFVSPDTKKMNQTDWLSSCNGFQSEHDPVELVRILVSKMKKEDINLQDRYGMTILHHAAFRGANFCCLFLLQRGADINLKDNYGNTSLTMALKGRNDRCAAALIQYGAILTVPITDPENYTAEDDLDNPEEDSTKKPLWKWIPQKPLKPPDQNESMSIFEFAIKYDLQGVCFLLMEKPMHESGVNFAEAVESGIRQHKYNVVLRLLSTTADVSSLQEDREHGRTLLHILSLNDFAPCRRISWELVERVVNELVSRGVTLTKQDDYKCTPLHYASLNHHYKLGAVFLKPKKSYNAKQKDTFNRTVLSAAFWNGRDSLDADLTWWVHDLCKKGANINELMDRPIPECVIGEEIQRTLTDPDYWRFYSTEKISPLIFSIAYNSVYFTQWLLKFGANINLSDSIGQSPLMYAVRGNNLDMVKTILNNNFEPGLEDEESEQEIPKKKRVVFTLKRKASAMSNSDKDGEEEEEEASETMQEEEDDQIEEKKYKPFKKTSKVNLNAADKNGWTVIHHVVCPLSFGTFDNDEMVYILTKAGAKLDVKNKKGETPLDLALQNGASKIAKMIQELEGVPEKNWRVPEVTYEYPLVTDKIKWTKPKSSFDEDAEKYINKCGKPMEVDETVVAIIDDECEVKNGSLVKDELEDVLYDVLLMKVDINRDIWSIFNFYLMQLIYQPGKDMYVLFTKWGVIGECGKFQHTPFHAKEEGIKEFCKIFESKTGNKWINVKSFDKKPGKYQLIPANERHNPPTQSDFEFEIESTVKSKLPEYLQDIMKVLTNREAHKDYMSRSNIDLGVLPFGRMKRERLIEATEILDEVSTIMKTVDHYRANAKPCDVDSKPSEQEDKLKEEYILALEKIVVLSGRYYQVIPQKWFNASRTRLLENASAVNQQTRLINHLLDSITARDLLLGAKLHENDTNLLDYVYRSLGCQIQPAEEGNSDSQYILRHIISSNPDTGVECIYRLQRDGERCQIDKRNLSNRRLLWFNVGPTNLANLFYSGPTPTPVILENMAFSGEKGISFSDTFSDVMTNSRESSYAVLCEVALGKTQTVYKPDQKRRKGYDSAYCVGSYRRDRKYDVQLATGYKLSFGERMSEYTYKGENLRIRDSMYVVYDSNQVCLRYIIKYGRG